jgi:hypothetical protein
MRKPSFMIVCLIIWAAVVAQAQSTNALRVNPNGNVAIGQTDAAEKLDVAGNIKSSGALIANQLRAAVGTTISVTGNINASGDITASGKMAADGDITSKGRVKDKTGFVMPVGTILPYAGATPPEGWLLCDGSALNRNDPQYAELFAAIGTAWGAPDVNTFNVPDLRGMFLRGVAGDATTDPDKATRVASKAGGNIGNAVGSMQTDEFKKHNHDPVRALGPWTSGNNAYLQAGSGNNPGGGSSDWYSYMRDKGGNETRPVNAYVNYIIKY